MHTTTQQDIIAMDDEVLELSLLLPHKQVTALETRARQQGVTVGQFIRQLIERQIRRPHGADPPTLEMVLPFRTFR